MNHVSEVWLQFEEKKGPHLLQLRIFSLGLLQDGDVGVGILPEREELVVSGLRLCTVRLQSESPGTTNERESVQRIICHQGAMVDKFLKLRGGFCTVLKKQVRLPSHVRGIKGHTEFDIGQRLAKFVWGSRLVVPLPLLSVWKPTDRKYYRHPSIDRRIIADTRAFLVRP